MPAIVRRLFRNQQAATLIEYSLIVALVATAAIGGMTAAGNGIRNVLNAASVAMN